MQGLMMDYPLTLTHILERARKLYPKKEIATKTTAGMHRYTYADMTARAGQLANAFDRLGISKDGRVATFAEHHLTPAEEAELIRYLKFIRSRKDTSEQA